MAFPGFASEFWKLSEAEIYAAAEVILEAKGAGTLAIFNVTAQATHLAVRQARRFAEMGCDALMCLPPFVVPSGADAALMHLRRVLEAAPLPHILQYAAALTGLKLTAESLRDLHREFPHFRCVKIDFIPPGPMLSQVREALGGPGFTFLIGYSGLQLADAVARGAHGLMGGAGHTAEDVAVLRALREGAPGALAAFERLLPMLNFEMQTVDLAIAVHKRLLRRAGVIASDSIRPPGGGLDCFQAAEADRHAAAIASLAG